MVTAIAVRQSAGADGGALPFTVLPFTEIILPTMAGQSATTITASTAIAQTMYIVTGGMLSQATGCIDIHLQTEETITATIIGQTRA